MSSNSAPFGLRPAYHPSGIIRPAAGTIASAYGTAILQFQPVKLVEGALQAAAPGDRFVGTFQGVEWTDNDGRRRYSNKWTAGTVGTEIVAYFSRDPALVYEIQSSATLALDTVGAQYDFSAASGSQIVGLSTQTLNVASAATNAGLRILGASPGPDNAFGDPFVIVQVQISEHQDVADVAAY